MRENRINPAAATNNGEPRLICHSNSKMCSTVSLEASIPKINAGNKATAAIVANSVNPLPISELIGAPNKRKVIASRTRLRCPSIKAAITTGAAPINIKIAAACNNNEIFFNKRCAISKTAPVEIGVMLGNLRTTASFAAASSLGGVNVVPIRE